MVKQISSICLIGAGNVASHLAGELVKHVNLVGVYSKSGVSAKELAFETGSIYFDDLNQMPACDLVLICVNDQAIEEIIEAIPRQYPIAYTSGSVAINQLPVRSDLGVFYPLQTFTKGVAVNLCDVPFLIEATNTTFAQELFDLAWKISSHVQFADSERRKKIHVAAVFVNNFTNHLIYQAKDYLQQEGIDWEILQPLLLQTVQKAIKADPYDAQTGPARRGDKQVISEHLSLLNGRKQEIYKVLTDSILEKYQSQYD